MHSVVHLLPYDGIGGAEVAARSALEAPMEGLDFRLRFLFPKVSSARQRRATFNPLAMASALRGLMRDKPDLQIVSLWRSCVVGTLLKLLRPRTRLVVLIHNSVDAHLLDWLFTRCAMAMADAVWVDSHASLQRRFRRPPAAPVRVISFLTHRLEPLDDVGVDARPDASFIFWGRLAAQKNVSRALGIFRRIHAARPDARFTIIGPDSGELASLRQQCVRDGLADAVTFTGPLEAAAIRRLAAGHRFYLQASRYEGMAMSVVEAMQYGLVPIVTPVGEIGSYCRDGGNAILIADDECDATRILQLLEEPAAWRALREGAIATWHGATLYRDAIATECRRLLHVTRTGE